uniref:Uncharacterized protein n=1 Tax=Ditylenchus dipsaci TaxID=166011 RepID=A0A915EF13_9BILA
MITDYNATKLQAKMMGTEKAHPVNHFYVCNLSGRGESISHRSDLNAEHCNQSMDNCEIEQKVWAVIWFGMYASRKITQTEYRKKFMSEIKNTKTDDRTRSQPKLFARFVVVHY